MSGAYAHITLGNLCREELRHNKNFSAASAYAISTFLAYVELGAISPDYPYLGGENDWADLMHHERSADFFRNGVALIQTLNGTPRHKLTAWLMGYAAHVAADVTIHPVVNLIVGPYEQHKADHRECEMHQDTHVFQRLNVGVDAGVTAHLTASLASCGDPQDPSRLDPQIAIPWRTLIQQTYPERFAAGAPSIDKWHGGFYKVMSAIRSANRMLPFARHVTSNLQLNYPDPAKLDARFLKGLPTPKGVPIEYDTLFDKAIANAFSLWTVLDGALSGRDAGPLKALKAWNLDTGEDVVTHKSVFWGGTP